MCDWTAAGCRDDVKVQNLRAKVALITSLYFLIQFTVQGLEIGMWNNTPYITNTSNFIIFVYIHERGYKTTYIRVRLVKT